jgi:hypothetical protein
MNLRFLIFVIQPFLLAQYTVYAVLTMINYCVSRINISWPNLLTSEFIFSKAEPRKTETDDMVPGAEENLVRWPFHEAQCDNQGFVTPRLKFPIKLSGT